MLLAELRVIEPVPLASLSALRVTPIWPLVDEIETPVLRIMERLAVRVRLALPPEDLVMLLATVISPNWVLVPAEAVVTDTEVPALRAV